MTLKREEIRILCQTNPDAIIALIEQQEARIVYLEARIAELEAHKNQNSRNSSRPPSTDIYARPQNPRKKGERSPGGQKGHKGNTLTSVENPDEVVVHTVHTCTECGASLESVTPENVKSRQVGDIPKPVIQAGR